jgi:hypothetical protein
MKFKETIQDIDEVIHLLGENAAYRTFAKWCAHVICSAIQDLSRLEQHVPE